MAEWKLQYFEWPPLYSNTALTLLGMEYTRASQVATGVLFHSSMTTSRSWWMLETLRSSTFHLRKCAAYGLSTDRLTPHPFNLCSTHMSISQTQPLDMTLSTCTQLLWLTMARHVLSGTCPVKPLYGLGHRAAAQFQGLGNLLIAYTISQVIHLRLSANCVACKWTTALCIKCRSIWKQVMEIY